MALGEHPGITAATTELHNAGTERWGYHATLVVQYSMGRPGSLEPLTGTAGMQKPAAVGIRPAEHASFELAIERGLTPGYYYTATVTLVSHSDRSAENNSQVITFFGEQNGRVTLG